MQKQVAKKLSKVFVLFYALSLMVLLGGCGSKTLPVWNITGSWYVYHVSTTGTAEQGPDLFTFTSTDNNLTGVTSLNQPLTGQVNGLDINFSWMGSDGASNTYTGVISADGATMAGTWTSTNGQSGTWNALVNLGPLVNVSGNWNTYLATSGSTGEQGPIPSTFTQSGNGISGTLTQGQQQITTTGSISRQDIIFFWTGSDGIVYAMTGTVTGNGSAMSGTWAGNKGQSGTWRAVRL